MNSVNMVIHVFFFVLFFLLELKNVSLFLSDCLTHFLAIQL